MLLAVASVLPGRAAPRAVLRMHEADAAFAGVDEDGDKMHSGSEYIYYYR